ncbi:sensor histidine kinase [Labilibaculum sp.]|uniref:sensor histidine kinase n=1 Tax=Labilibaculum sp. TaxID=2060723 RepID=UPI003562971E
MKNLNLTQKFTLYGFAFGLLFPFMAFTFDLQMKDLPFTLMSIKQIHFVNPIHYIIDTAPFIISIVAFLVGRQVYTQDMKAKLTIEKQLLKINKKNEELEVLNSEKDKFFSIIAHDLRNPFIGLLGLTKMMSEQFSILTMDEMKHFATNIENSATVLFRLLENLLNWSRMRQHLVPFEPQKICLSENINECCEAIIESTKSKAIEISCDIEDDIKIYADKNMLQLVIRNLVSNAVKFTPKGGKIVVSAKLYGAEKMVISVKDTGIGMTTKMIDNLFRLGVKTNRKGTEGEPSTGLGLLLCKEFVEKNGGKIWVESKEGKGSIFKFTLPTMNHIEEPNKKPIAVS